MVVERWNRDQIVFTLSGLVTWYVAYVAFRNLKSYVPFVTDRLWDTELARSTACCGSATTRPSSSTTCSAPAGPTG